jgi:hypothetical protein
VDQLQKHESQKGDVSYQKKTRVVDPYSFFTDPDPDPELDGGGQYGSRALMTKS